MKTLAHRLLQIFDQVRGIFQSDRHANGSWFYPRAPRFLLAHAVVRTVNRQQYQRLYTAKAHREQK
jgi:hypothetical protein